MSDDQTVTRQKTQILLNGCAGRLGGAIAGAVAEAEATCGCEIRAGVDIKVNISDAFPIFHSLADYTGHADVIVDCSHHSAVTATGLLEYARSHALPIVICTTGHTPEEMELIKSAAREIPIFQSANMSIGVNLVASLAGKVAKLLYPDYDVEIVEAHHNRKLDAPSGTALMLADAVNEAVGGGMEYVYDRRGLHAARDSHQLGISSIRGGTIVGEHEVIFAGRDEVIKLSHSAQSRELFAQGALLAVRYMTGKPAGYYTMQTLMEELMRN